MKSAPLHPQEKERLEALNSLGILDTMPEQEFDNITFIASQICQTPIALITLIDRDRQWFKSKVGLDGVETKRELAFCAHAILSDEVMHIKDSYKDDRFSDNPYVLGAPHVRFYAGAPLYSESGFALGTVCVLDSKPRELNSDQIKALQGLSRQVTKLLTLRLQIAQLEESKRQVASREENLCTILNAIPSLISHWSVDLINLHSNNKYFEYLGKSPEQVEGRHMREVLGEEIFKQNIGYIQAVQVGITQAFEKSITFKDGTIRHVIVNYIPEKRHSRVVSFFVVATDITEHKKMEEERQALEMQLIESAKFSLLGEMAGGVAHEINNPLAIIKGKASQIERMLENGLQDSNRLCKEVIKISSTVDRIAKVTSALRTYAKDTGCDPFEEFKLAHILNDILALCRERFKSHQIQLEIACASTIKLECRPNQISHTIFNLLNNAFDAVQALPERWVKIEVQAKRDQIEVRVSDSGHGINPAIAEKLMNPFFTTKEVGKGTGLGLSVARGIAMGHGGSLVYDEKAPNTTFVLTLPIHQI